MGRKTKKDPELLTVEDRYHNIIEEIKTGLDDPSLTAFHELIDRAISRVETLYGPDSRRHVRQKVVKVLVAAVESRAARQFRAEDGLVRNHIPKRRIPDWRNF
jgi:hypothetical protein